MHEHDNEQIKGPIHPNNQVFKAGTQFYVFEMPMQIHVELCRRLVGALVWSCEASTNVGPVHRQVNAWPHQ